MPEPAESSSDRTSSDPAKDQASDRASSSLPPRLQPPPADRGPLVVRHPQPGEEDLHRVVVDASFGSPFHAHTPQEAAEWEALTPVTNRLLVAERSADGTDRVLGGAARLDTAISLPGGARVPVAGLTGVGVAPGEQHRGAFGALLDAHLDECRERGDAASVLMASESVLYGRFGYGQATRTAGWEIDASAARSLQPDAPTSGRVALEHGRGTSLDELLASVAEASGSRRAGALTRSPAWWKRVTAPTSSWMGGGRLMVALHWTQDGGCDGYVLYDVDAEYGRPALAEAAITVRELVAVDVAAELDLWRFVADLPWGQVIRWPYGPIDPAAQSWLSDVRTLQPIWHADFLWLRPLNLAALTAARTFAADGTVALEIGDPQYPDLSGRFDLVVSDGRGQWLPGAGPAALRASIAELGSLWLGDVSALRLLGARRIAGDARAAVLLDSLLAVDVAPRSLARF